MNKMEFNFNNTLKSYKQIENIKKYKHYMYLIFIIEILIIFFHYLIVIIQSNKFDISVFTNLFFISLGAILIVISIIFYFMGLRKNKKKYFNITKITCILGTSFFYLIYIIIIIQDYNDTAENTQGKSFQFGVFFISTIIYLPLVISIAILTNKSYINIKQDNTILISLN